METTVPFWETESLAIEIIKCDLKHQQLVDLLRKSSQKYRNRSTLDESVCWLLGVSKPTLQRELTKSYKEERKKASEASRCVDKEANAIYLGSKYSTELYYTSLLQEPYSAELTRQGIDKLILNLIKNDLIHTRLLYELNNPENVDQYFSLVEPIIWLCKHWDAKQARLRKQSYKRISKKTIEMSLSEFNNALESLANETFLKMKKSVKKTV